MPEGMQGDYPVTASISRYTANDRQVITILELDASPEEFASIRASLASR